MKWTRPESLVQIYGVKIVGWPTGAPGEADEAVLAFSLDLTSSDLAPDGMASRRLVTVGWDNARNLVRLVPGVSSLRDELPPLDCSSVPTGGLISGPLAFAACRGFLALKVPYQCTVGYNAA
jgi:hypothetical protein